MSVVYIIWYWLRLLSLGMDELLLFTRWGRDDSKWGIIRFFTMILERGDLSLLCHNMTVCKSFPPHLYIE